VAITSSIDPTVGLASSASVTVALLAALKSWVDGSFDRHDLLSECCSVIRAVQGYGSGADAASIIYGGVIAYQMDDLECTPLTASLPLVLIYSGKKTPTPEVIRYVQEREKRFPVIYKDIFSAINDVTAEAILAVQAYDLPLVGQLMNQANGFMEALDVGTPELSHLCWKLRSEPAIFGAKISGSGLGDAVIGVGVAPLIDVGRRLASSVSTQGVEVIEWKE
jgi:mevalonate kinase